MRVGTQLWMRSATCCAAYLVLLVLSRSFPSCLARLEETLSRSTPLLRQELSHENNCCDVSCRDQIEFTSMSQLAKPEVVGLLIQQSRDWQFQRITSFDVQLLREGGLTNRSWESQAVDLLIVVIVFVLLPMRIEIEAISPVVVQCCVTSW